MSSRRSIPLLAASVGLVLAVAPLPASAEPVPTAGGTAAAVRGPIPGTVPGDRLSDRLEDTYPFFSTPVDLAGHGYVEEEFYLSGSADGWSTTGTSVATDVPYTTRVIVRRPKSP